MIYNPETTGVDTRPRIFLAGSIESGKAVEWQGNVAKMLDSIGFDVYNPRRTQWSELDQENLHDQIVWELDSIHRADGVLMYFAPNTISPISLLEFGMILGGSKPLFLVVDKEYARKENVLVTLDFIRMRTGRANVFLCDELDYAVGEISVFPWKRFAGTYKNG